MGFAVRFGPLVAGLVVVSQLAASHVYAAPPPLRVGPSTLPAGMPEADTQRLDTSLRSGLDRVELSVTDAADAPVLRLTITAGETDHLVLLEVQDAAGETIAEAEVKCELCGVAELSESIAGAASRLRQRLDLLSGAVTLTVRSDPEAADVFVDGEPAGTTPVGTSIAPGPHELRVERKGYRPMSSTFEAAGGQNSAFDYALRPRAYRVAVPASLIGGGALLVAGGAALVAIHGNPIASDCNADIAGNCEFIRRTRPAGAAAISVGALALVSGVVLALVWRSRSPRASGSTARLRRQRWSL